MDPTSAVAASGWLAIATGPYGGAFVAGLLFGACLGIYLWQKFHVQPRLKQEEAHCAARIAALQKEVDDLKLVADKWNQFMERKAFEFLERK